MSATCKACGSDRSLFRFVFPDADQPPIARWELKCMDCGEWVGGAIVEGSEPADVVEVVAEKFEVGNGQA
jgi:hypothetical protein